jgi:hypothetical protein
VTTTTSSAVGCCFVDSAVVGVGAVGCCFVDSGLVEAGAAGCAVSVCANTGVSAPMPMADVRTSPGTSAANLTLLSNFSNSVSPLTHFVGRAVDLATIDPYRSVAAAALPG